VRLALGATVLATATACGGEKKADPYAASLAKRTVHVEFAGTVGGQRVLGSGDFAGDRGRVVIHTRNGDVREVVDGHTIYTRLGSAWHVGHAAGPQTPAQMFRARVPATAAGGLVRRIVRDGIAYTFSNYGERVSVTVPRVKGSK
jgi:hypothetical protein